jgi:hypothetical protein
MRNTTLQKAYRKCVKNVAYETGIVVCKRNIVASEKPNVAFKKCNRTCKRASLHVAYDAKFLSFWGVTGPSLKKINTVKK